MKKVAAKHREHRAEHRAVPYNKIAKLWAEGKSYLQIGKAIDRLAPKGDLTKPTRAIISRMLNAGYPDENGKTIVLKPREGMRNLGVGKNAPGNGTGKKAAKVAVKARKQNSKGPAILVALHSSGKFVRLEVGKAKALPKTETILPSLIEVVEKSGYKVVPNTVAQIEEAAPAKAESASAPTNEAAPVTPVTEPKTETEPQTEAAPATNPAPQTEAANQNAA